MKSYKEFKNIVEQKEQKEQKDYNKLIKLIVELNLMLPINIDNKLNKKMNEIEKELKSMGYNTRSIKGL